MKKLLQHHLVRWSGLCLLAVFALTACGKGCGKAKVSKEEAKALQLIPAESNVIVGLNWKKLQDSPLGEKMREEIPDEVKPFLQEIDGITLGIQINGVGAEPENFLAVVSGKLDSAKLLAQMTEMAKKEGNEVSHTEYDGIKIYTNSKDPDVGVAFIGEQGVIGKNENVKKAIDLSKNKGDSIEKNQAVMEMVKAMDTDKMLWAVGLVPEGAIPAGSADAGPGNPLAAVSGIKALDLAVDYAGDLTVDLGVLAAGESEAQQMTTMANSYKTLFGASLAQKDPTAGKVLSGLTINSSGNRVTLNLKIDKATVDELSQKAKQKNMAPAPAPSMPDEPMGEGGSGDEEQAPSEEG